MKGESNTMEASMPEVPPPQQANSNEFGFLNKNKSKVTLITNQEIRYEGVLDEINVQNQSIRLINVRSHGTEGRRPDNEIAAQSDFFDKIIFHGKDIKDIVVLSNEQQQQQQQQEQQQQQQLEKNQENNLNYPTATPDIQNVKQEKTNEQQKSIQQTPPKQQQQQQIQYNQKPKQQQHQQQGHYRQQQTEYVQKAQQPEEIQQSQQQQQKQLKQFVGYQSKKSFFDNISNSTTEKNLESKEQRLQQNQIDKQTFGYDYISSSQARRRGNNMNRGGRGNNNMRQNYQMNYYQEKNQGYYQNNYNNRNYRQDYYGQQQYESNYGRQQQNQNYYYQPKNQYSRNEQYQQY
eukprot:TRINITY_DN6626_c0_g1_i2.p1 TRINITY_DN6626_c0_g1~~TRINITY_DN6626_c0_g1_i2.p1  ORF type:complete len:347 (-),score=96.19 TRINITY_DN6626_c0_g1_i2:179-1219(-)